MEVKRSSNWQVIVLLIIVLATSVCDGARQVTLTCGNDDDDDVSVRGPPGVPGKKGIVGDQGIQGPKGSKGEPGENDSWMEVFERMQQRIQELEKSLSQNTNDLKTVTSNDCKDVLNLGFDTTGIYKVNVGEVYCDMETSGGGWLVFQRRIDGSENFYRDWDSYARGFGNISGEFWLGLDALHEITSRRSYILRVELEDEDSNMAYAEYSTFSIGRRSENYVLTASGFSGDAGDSLEYHNGSPFSTRDSDNDASPSHCAEIFKAAWWYKACHYSNLNGQYRTPGPEPSAQGVDWRNWKGEHYSMKSVEMKIRPT
ncbi:unnamed protein product [Clavelina lepadiformis]|uniref:Fibrinogen C-terminal domain-containing protein n=1 Tax=Clavelina lepadiformis TaxID=159417 RepID=A0ABP0GW89_CLALP